MKCGCKPLIFRMGNFSLEGLTLVTTAPNSPDARPVLRRWSIVALQPEGDRATWGESGGHTGDWMRLPGGVPEAA